MARIQLPIKQMIVFMKKGRANNQHNSVRVVVDERRQPAKFQK